MNKKQCKHRLKCARYHAGHPIHARVGGLYVGKVIKVPDLWVRVVVYPTHAKIVGFDLNSIYDEVVITFEGENIHRKLTTHRCSHIKTSHTKRGVGLKRPNGWVTFVEYLKDL